ncbi:ABC transporter permease [Ruminococcus albus]|uniref:Putative ABC transport system permease protein n=1 Tax=Ruminococcus albus TaxID=1264 RepID=A0A1H7IA32_RUMAL|nr:ABC transporter permease [Ruminococcus albus]SEK57435.1 putative ABC transport system permease protein [Ruminococcus albus]
MIRKLAFRSLLAEKFRCVCTIIAMILTALLFSTLFTTAAGLNSANDYYEFKKLGTTAHVVVKEWDKDFNKVDAIRENVNVDKVGCRRFFGYAVNSELNYNVEISFMDEAESSLDFYTPTGGKMPAEVNEVAMDTTTMAALGIPQKVGAPVDIDMEVNGETVTESFVLAGWFDINKAYPVKVGQIMTSEKYGDVWDGKFESGTVYGKCDIAILLKDAYDIEGQTEEIFNEAGLEFSQDMISVNPGYNVSSEAMSSETLMTLVVGILVIVLICYLIINNIFYISARKDAKQFGRLKTIGMSNKHLAAFVRFQAFIMLSVAIPLGIVGGYFMGRLILPAILRQTAYDSVADDTVISGGTIALILAAAALFVVITTLISINGPIRMIKKLSPIESSRIELKGYKSTRKSNDGSKAHKFARYNILRNKKSLAMLLVSISLPILLVIVSYDAFSSFDMDKYLSTMLVTDYTFATSDYYKNDYVDTDNNVRALDRQIVDEIQNSGFVEDGSIVYGDIANDYASVKEINLPEGEEYVLDLYGTKEFALDESLIIEDNIDMEAFNNGTGIVEGCWLTSDGDIYPGTSQFATGDTVTITSNDGTERSYTVLGHINVALGALKTGITRGSFACELYMNPEQYESITGNRNIMSYEFNVKKGMEKDAEKFIKSMTAADNSLNYQSKYSLADDFASMKLLVKLICTLLCVVLTFIAIMNLINVFVSSIMVREKEIATLKSIGMTRGQLRKMLLWEIFYYNGIAFVIAAVLSLIFSPTVLKSIFNEFPFLTFRVNWTSYPAIILVIMFVGIMTVLLVEKKVSKMNIPEELKTA